MSVFGKIQQLLKRHGGGSPQSKPSRESLDAIPSRDCVRFPFKGLLARITPDELIEYGSAQSQLLAYLLLDGQATVDDHGVSCSWETIYKLIDDRDYLGIESVLGLPEVISARLVLRETGTVADSNFSIHCDSFRTDSSREFSLQASSPIQTTNGCSTLLNSEAFRLLLQLDAARSKWGKQSENEKLWGQLRPLCVASNAVLSPYLHSTVVVVPETLRLNYSKVMVSDTPVVTVEPDFEGAPSDWVRTFDSLKGIPDHLDFTGGTGRQRVIFSDEVRSVLNTIKRDFPGRRVAGSRSQAFLRNPFALLGESASPVLDEQHIEHQRAQVGLSQSRLTLHPEISSGQLVSITALIATAQVDGQSQTLRQIIASVTELTELVDLLDAAIADESQYFSWRAALVDLDGDSPLLAQMARTWISVWSNQMSSVISFDEIYQLDNYNERVEGIGVAKPIYSAFLKKEGGDETPWIPENLTPYVSVQLTPDSQPVYIPLTDQWLDSFALSVERAKASGKDVVADPQLPLPISTSEAESLLTRIRTARSSDAPASESPPGSGRKEVTPKIERETLLLKANINELSYSETDLAENRNSLLKVPDDFPVQLPLALKEQFTLKDHQLANLAWMQFLLSRGPTNCRGSLLADDMGLGKTLQLLSLLSWAYEQGLSEKPSLIIAPVALLKNWANESKKFFHEFPEILVLHGPNLKVRKQPRELIDGGLLEKRIANLLAKEWLGTAKIVLTTYETVRDYEFSLAKQDFFLMICDEAQKIKAPNALVTTACKKQKSDFRIACTGTPVENSLADLWCLFDFIQPGLLGALDTFSKSYRRPIEVHQSGDQDAAKALNVLRTTIAPQVRRTMKQDIAKDLPRKIIVSNARYNHLGRDREQLTIPMSAKQLQMYADGLNKIKSASEIDDSSERARVTFGLLHYIKTLCADPYAIATEGASPDRYGSPEHIQDSPKTAWLIETLRSISVKSEKAIIFTETIKIQQILVSVIHRHFGLSPSVINGDTDNRQDVIDSFQDVDGFNVLILSPLAAGFGVNIVAANHVIHYTRTWNPAKEGQATDRAYRIGQQRDVFVYCPTIVGRDFVSFEQKLDMLMSEKSDLAGDMLDGIGEQISFQSLLPSDGPHGAKVAASRPIDMGVVDSLDGHSFEHFCQLYFASQGFDSIVTPKSPGDGGVDVVAIKNSKGLLVQCKHTGSEEIGWDAIKEIYAGAAAYRAKYPGIEFELVAITNRYYNGSARGQALTLGVRLVQRNDLASILSKLSISTSQLDEVLIRTGFIR